MDIPTLVLAVIAAFFLVLIILALPSYIKERKEFLRRKKLTPFQRAIEDVTKAFDEFTVALLNSFTPTLLAVAAMFEDLTKALENADEEAGD